MAAVYHSICMEVDSLFLKIGHLVEKEIRYKMELEKLMTKGFVHIAKARYIMGSTCVTKMQLPTSDSSPIQPIATVCRAERENHWVFHIHRKDQPDRTKEKGYDFEDMGNKSELTFKAMLQSNPKALKNSKKAYHVDDELYKDYNEELLDEISTDSVGSVSDPIRLFGILVPNTLKQGQHWFKEATSLLGKCATIQSELDYILRRYMHMIKVKKMIETVALEKLTDIDPLQPKVYWTPSDRSSESCTSSLGQPSDDDDDLIKKGALSVKKSIISVSFDFSPKESEPETRKSEYGESNEEF